VVNPALVPVAAARQGVITFQKSSCPVAAALTLEGVEQRLMSLSFRSRPLATAVADSGRDTCMSYVAARPPASGSSQAVDSYR